MIKLDYFMVILVIFNLLIYKIIAGDLSSYIELYENEHFQGWKLKVTETISELSSIYSDKASSLKVFGPAMWELYDQANFGLTGKMIAGKLIIYRIKFYIKSDIGIFVF